MWVPQLLRSFPNQLSLFHKWRNLPHTPNYSPRLPIPLAPAYRALTPCSIVVFQINQGTAADHMHQWQVKGDVMHPLYRQLTLTVFAVEWPCRSFH